MNSTVCNRMNSQFVRDSVIYPDPGKNRIWVKPKGIGNSCLIVIYNSPVLEINSFEVNGKQSDSDELTKEISVTEYAGCVYLLKVICPEKVISSTFVLY